MKSNIEYLREDIDKLGDGELKDQLHEWAEAVEHDMDGLRDDTDKKQERIEELEGEIEEEILSYTTIPCGIGEINYQTDNLQLQQLMEALAQRIENEGPAKILWRLSHLPGGAELPNHQHLARL